MSKPISVPYETTIHVRDTCLCLAVQRAARALARRFDEALRPYDLTNGQFSLLMSLNRPAPPNLSSVASLLAMDRTTLTAALKPLERRGLVTVVVDPADKRSRLMALTPDGKKLYVANGRSNSVSVIDTVGGKVVKEIAVGELPWGVSIPQ